jgi:hypothetical protein
MTKLKWLCLFLLLCSPAWAQYLVQNITVKQNGVANLQTKRNAFVYFNITLTNNATTSFIDVGVAGAKLDFNICQDPTGGWTWVWPPNFTGTSTIAIATTPATCTAASFLTTDGLTWANAAASGAVIPPAVPAGSPIQTQVNNGGGPPNVFGGAGCQTFANKDTGPMSDDCDTHFKGPNPYVDVTRYGVRSLAPTVIPASTGITATISSGSSTATISTTSCPSQVITACFVNGDGAVITGAGAAHSMTTPGAPTVTPALAIAGTGTGLVTTTVPAGGATTYNYQIIAVTKQRGRTAASTVGSTAVGAAALGAQQVNLTSCSRSNDVVTCTTSSAHGFAVGCSVTTCGEVYIRNSIDNGNSGTSFNAWWAVASAADSTHFTFTSGIDSRGGAATAATGGTAQWFNCNHLTWTSVTGAFLYYIYGRTGGSLTLIGISRPQASDIADTTWDDFGSPMMDNFSFPPDVPNTPPGTATSNDLVTTITGGAGTTTLTLANAASTAVSGAIIRFDNGPNILTAYSAISNASAGGAQGGSLYFPADNSAGNNFYVVNSYISFPAPAIPIIQSGQIWLNGTLEFRIGQKWYGDRPFPQKGVLGQFSHHSNPIVTTNTAYPGVYIDFGNLPGLQIQGVDFGTNVSNGAIIFFAEGQFQYSFDDVTFSTSTAFLDYMGIAVYMRGRALQSAAFGQFRKITFLAGGPSEPAGDGATHTPIFFCNICGVTKMENIFGVRRGLFFSGNSAGGSYLDINLLYWQGDLMPVITVSNVFGGGVKVTNATLDTVPHPLYTALPSSGPANSSGSLELGGGPNSLLNGDAGLGGVVTVSGLRVAVKNLTTVLGSGQYTTVNRDSDMLVAGQANDGLFGQGTSPYMIRASNASQAIGPSYSSFITNATQPAPTCAISAGGAVSLATYTFRIMPVWQNGSEGVSSYVSTSCTTTTGNQTVTVTWSAFPGNPKAYDVLASSGGGYTIASTVTTTSVVYTAAGVIGSGGVVAASVPSGGPTMLMPGVQGMTAPAYVLPTASLGFADTTIAPASLIYNRSHSVVAQTDQNSAYENCNRADGAIGSNWTAITGSYNCVSNQIKGNIGSDNISFRSDVPFPGTQGQFSQATMAVLSSRSGPAVYLTATAGYACVETTTALAIFNISSGNLNSQLATTAISGVNGDVVRFETVPTSVAPPSVEQTLNCYLNGVLTTTTTVLNGTTSGSPGLDIFAGTVRVDNWSGGYLHPIAQLDTEQDWTQPQHFIGPITVGPTNPVAGALCSSCLYAGGPIATVNNVATVGPGVPALVAKVDLTARSADIAQATLYSVPANGAGMYRVSAYSVVTTAAGTSSTLPQILIAWTDNDTNVNNNSAPAQWSLNNTGNAVGSTFSEYNTTAAFIVPPPGFVVNAHASSNILYSTSGYASNPAAAMQFALHIKVEYLGQ